MNESITDEKNMLWTSSGVPQLGERSLTTVICLNRIYIKKID